MNSFISFSKRRERTSSEKSANRQLSIAKTGNSRATKIWSVGGGKGGVGKTLAASNLGICLAQKGYRVLMIDADLGSANLHTFLGIEGARVSLSSFLKSDSIELKEIIIKTYIENLDVITGARDSLDVVDIKADDLARLGKGLNSLEYDYVILDISPGTASNNLDIFLMAHEGIIITTPEPTAIENTYRYLKCLVLRRIRNIINSPGKSSLKEILTHICTEKQATQIKTIADIIALIKKYSSDKDETLKELMDGTRISLLLNQVRDPEDAKIGIDMSRACQNYFWITMPYLGHLRYENLISESIRYRKPLAIYYSETEVAAAIKSIVDKLTMIPQERVIEKEPFGSHVR